MDKMKTNQQFIRVSGRLREIVTVKDEKGTILHRLMRPVMLEFYPRDLLQVIIGASILAVPVAFTEEVWNLGASMSWQRVGMLSLLSFLFIGLFVFYNYYRDQFKNHRIEYIKRVLSTYVLSLLVVAALLTIIDRAPWTTDLVLAVKRSMIVGFPASMSAAVADMVK